MPRSKIITGLKEAVRHARAMPRKPLPPEPTPHDPSCPAVTSADMHPCECGAEWEDEVEWTEWGSATDDDDVLPLPPTYQR